jgi:hypothetical protein
MLSPSKLLLFAALLPPMVMLGCSSKPAPVKEPVPSGAGAKGTKGTSKILDDPRKRKQTMQEDGPPPPPPPSGSDATTDR